MCFNSGSEDFGVTKSGNGGVPIPSRKPSIQSSGGGILDYIYDAGRSVLNTVGSIELQKYEAERLADVRAAEQEGKLAQTKTLAGVKDYIDSLFGTQSTINQNKTAISSSGIVVIGLVGLAAVFIAKK